MKKSKRDSLDGIATGYCLSDDLWRQHTWGIRQDAIVETLGKRDIYFGILLTGIDADVFAFQMLSEDKGNWPLLDASLVGRVQVEFAARIAARAVPVCQ